MRKGHILLLFALVASTLVQAQAGKSMAELRRQIGPVLEKTSPWLVTVRIYGGTRAALTTPPKKKGKKKRRRPSRPFPVAKGATTGVIVSKEGLIATSLWSLQLAPSAVIVTLSDGRKFTATLLGRDFSRGLGLLKIEAKDLPTPRPCPVEKIQPGMFTLALGRTFSAKLPAASLGIVSAVGRMGGKAIQTDANTSPSNYGGALVDLKGRIIGIIAPLAPGGYAAGIKWYDSGIGFAADWHGLARVIPLLTKGKDLHPGLLGIGPSLSDLGPGVTVTRVSGPAKKAGIQRGDKIIALNKIPIKNSFHLSNLIASLYSGDRVSLVVKRKGQELCFLIKLERKSMAQPLRSPLLPRR